MKFTAVCSSLTATLGRVKKACPQASSVVLMPKKRNLWVVCSDASGCARFRADNVVVDEPGEGPVTLLIDAMRAAIKGRDTLTFCQRGGKLEFTDGKRYSGALEAQQPQEILVAKPAEGEGIIIPLTPESFPLFADAIKGASLSGSFDGAEYMTMFLQLDDQGLTALCFDSYYMARVYEPRIPFGGEPQTLQLECDALLLALELCGSERQCMLVLTENRLYVEGPGFASSQPTMQGKNNAASIQQVDTHIAAWQADSRLTHVTVDRVALAEALSNVSGFASRGVGVSFAVQSKGLVVSVKGKDGSLKDKLEGTAVNPDKDARYPVEFQLLSEVLGKIRAPLVTLSFVSDRVLYIEHQDGDDGPSIFVSAALCDVS